MVDGSDTEIARAEAILTGRGIEDFGIYDIPGSTTTGTSYAEPDTLNTTTTTTTASTGVVSDRNNMTTGDPKVVIVDRREEI